MNPRQNKKKLNRIIALLILLLFMDCYLVAYGIVSKIQGVDTYAKIQGIAIASIKSVNGEDLPIVNETYTAPYIEGNQIYSEDGEPLYLAGANIGLEYDVANSYPGMPHTKEDLWQLMNTSGANLIVFDINPELWENDPDQADYRTNIDQFVTWCNTYGFYYHFRIHAIGSGPYPTKYGTPGKNYKLADLGQVGQPGYYHRSMEMWKDLATLYGGDDNFVGVAFLNEPYSGSDYSKWDMVVAYYEDVIGNVTAIDPDCIFWAMEPYGWSGQCNHWRTRGYLSSDQVIYEFHQYYHHGIGWQPWANYYAAGNNASGYSTYLSDLTNVILPASDDGHPVFCGEYGIWATYDDLAPPTGTGIETGITPDPNFIGANDGQQNAFAALNIHYAYYYMVNSRVNAYGWYGLNPTGTALSRRGEIWAQTIPADLIKP